MSALLGRKLTRRVNKMVREERCSEFSVQAVSWGLYICITL